MKSLTGLSEVADQFDGFILDLWGLVHDGASAYPGVVQTLEALKRADIKTILLSNAPRRSRLLVDGMTSMGIPRDLYDHVFSSGEATWQELMARSDSFFAVLGENAYHIGPERDVSILEETGAADFILNTGPVELHHTVDEYLDLLEAARSRDLPMVCANPDEVVIRAGNRVVCAGAIARRYESLGGRVTYRGKPDPAVYHLAANKLGIKDTSRIAVVGDALETDVAGADASGFRAIWCTGGIHAEALGVSYGKPAETARAAALAESHGRSPWAIIPGFSWN